ncbi:MAG: hypothetical protein B5M53_08725 [Candidatus Cloacimonas sp. 4484_209]|nr:MAG: hypothetical protein B5M53_08725 [Candidatus Cloacimonas sp. 4484_209]
MIIAFSSDDNRGLDGVLAYHFGRCPYFTFVEVDGEKIKQVTVQENPYVNSHEPGEVPQYIHNKGAEMIVAGGMGPRAQEWFTNLGVKPIAGAYGKIRDLIGAIIQGPAEISTPSTAIEQHHSTGESDESERLKKEVVHLREVIADLNERLKKLEKK